MNETKNATDSTTLAIHRTFDAPRERVFAAFTEAAIMRRWMGPPGTDVTEAAFDPREGGTYRIVMESPQYGVMIVKGVITALRRPEHIAYTWRWEGDNAPDEHETFVRIDFIAQGERTEVILTHDGFVSEESRTNHENGWKGAFAKIDAVL